MRAHCVLTHCSGLYSHLVVRDKLGVAIKGRVLPPRDCNDLSAAAASASSSAAAAAAAVRLPAAAVAVVVLLVVVVVLTRLL
jgi:hypothetical protein